MHSNTFFQTVKEDLEVTRACWYNKTFWLTLFLRGAQYAKFSFVCNLFKVLKRVLLFGTGCELPASALLGGGLYIPHLNGIIVSPYAKVCNDVTIMQQVTLGVDFTKDPYAAPTIGSGTLLGAGAKVIGGVKVGSNCLIGANAVVTKDIPDGKTVVGGNRIVG